MKNNLVVQTSALIEAHYKQEYSVQEQRTILWVISEIHKESYFSNQQYKNKPLHISAQKYAELMGISVKNVYRDAQKIGEKLMEKVLKIKTDNGWKMFHWVSSMQYIKNEAVLEISLSDMILPYIIELKQYTAFKLENILHLKSAHAIKMYQLLIQYKKIGERIINLVDLRSILGISELKSYMCYKGIKQKILNISQREINEKTDINISYLEIKKGRTVEAIKFKISQKTLRGKKLISTSFSKTVHSNKIKSLILEKARKIIIESKTSWDLYAIEQQFYDYIDKVGQPKNLESAFLGFVKKKVQMFP